MPYSKVIYGPVIRGPHIGLRAAIWHTKAEADAGDKPFIDDWFLFGREKSVGQKIVTDPVDDWPLLSDNSRAPNYDLAGARQKALDDSPSLRILQELVSAVPVTSPQKETVDQQWDVLRDTLKDRYLGQPYLPSGESWKTESIPTLDVAEIKETILGRYNREVQTRQTNQEILNNNPSIGDLAEQEFDL